jgi:DNA (cytosine-5)-methyltransferase 1
LFSGAGGLDLGFHWAGYVARVAIDNNEAAQHTYERNHPGAIFYNRDLSKIRAGEIARLWRRNCAEESPSGVIAGPPCQAFSRGNARPALDDSRRDLPNKYAQLLWGLNKAFDLDFFVFENVAGLAGPRHKEYYDCLLTAFRRAGFNICQIDTDASAVGVPQRRRRLFIVGLNRRKFGPTDITIKGKITEMTTLRQAIGHLPEPTHFDARLSRRSIPFHPNHWVMVPRSGKFTNGMLRVRGSNGRSFRVLKWDEPSLAVSFGHREMNIHPSMRRRISVLEAMLIQGFPFGYELLGTLSDQARLVSDAVPPPLAFAVARAISDALSRTGDR